MDRQHGYPCGSNEAMAYYIAKNLSKAEPNGLDSGIAQAIQQIQREETKNSRKLLRICMKILHERQVSAAECAYRLCHIPLRDSSRSCISLNTRSQNSVTKYCNSTEADTQLVITVISLKDMKNVRYNILTTILLIALRDLLIALRVGELTSKHLEILLGKVSRDTTEKFSIERALRIYPTDDPVARHNEKVLQSFEDKGTAIYTIKAQDQLIDATRNLHNKDLNSIIPNDINKTGGLPNVLKIFVGAIVMLRSNIDVFKSIQK